MDILFILCYITFPFFAIILMRAIGLSLLKITIPSFLIISMFVFAYIGLLPLYFAWDEYRYVTGIKSKYLVFKVLLYSSWTIISLIFGFAYARYILHFRPVRFQQIRNINKKEIVILIILMLFSISVFIFYLNQITKIAFFVSMQNSTLDEINIARSLMGNGFSGKYHWYKLFIHNLQNIITYIFFASWLISKKRLLLLLFFISFLASTFSSVMAAEKGPFVWLLIGLFLTHSLVRLNGEIYLKSIIKLIFILLTVLVVFYIYFSSSRDIFSALLSIFSRSFTGAITPAYFYLEYFPYNQDFLLGRSFPNPMGILPFETFNLTVEIMNWKFPQYQELGIIGTMPTVFWGEIYANFGTIGVLTFPFLVGIGIYFIHTLTSKLENTSIKIGFVVWLILHYRSLAESGISDFMLDFYLIGISGMIFLILAIANEFKIKYYKFKGIK